MKTSLLLLGSLAKCGDDDDDDEHDQFVCSQRREVYG
jgi:hypothetical protein